MDIAHRPYSIHSRHSVTANSGCYQKLLSLQVVSMPCCRVWSSCISSSSANWISCHIDVVLKLVIGCRCDLFDVGDALTDQGNQNDVYMRQLPAARRQNQGRIDAMMDARRYSPDCRACWCWWADCNRNKLIPPALRKYASHDLHCY